jgi:hypothetical protein
MHSKTTNQSISNNHTNAKNSMLFLYYYIINNNPKPTYTCLHHKIINEETLIKSSPLINIF